MIARQLALMLVAAAALAACGGGENEELQQWMKDQRAKT
jgi:Tfp pilus assembly protein PilP